MLAKKNPHAAIPTPLRNAALTLPSGLSVVLSIAAFQSSVENAVTCFSFAFHAEASLPRRIARVFQRAPHRRAALAEGGKETHEKGGARSSDTKPGIRQCARVRLGGSGNRRPAASI